MSYAEQIKEALNKMSSDEIIVASSFHAENLSNVPEATYYKTISRLVAQGQLMRMSKGVYRRQEAEAYAYINLENEAVSSVIANGVGSEAAACKKDLEMEASNETKLIRYYLGADGRQGTIIGDCLLFEKHLIGNRPETVEILSSKFSGTRKHVGNLIINGARMRDVGDYRAPIETLEILSRYESIPMDGLNEFVRFVADMSSQYSDDKTNELLRYEHYRKCHIAFLADILDGYKVRHTLDRWFSKTSVFKYPSYEQLVERAQSEASAGSCVGMSLRPDDELRKHRARNFPEVVRQVELGEDSAVANGEFLDEFYHADAAERQAFITAEPFSSDAAGIDGVFYANCAGVAEKLASDYRLVKPLWTEKPCYFLNKPHIDGFESADLSTKLIETLRRESPPEFSRRNLFVTSNVLTRY